MTPPDTELAAASVDLSTAPPFRLGDLTIVPSRREVRPDGGEPALAEPRVLQVLIVLAGAAGQVVSRDLLIQRCWDGRIVSDDAINRSIAKTRQLADLTRPPSFTIETVPRVGYRLLPAPGRPGPSPSSGTADAPPQPAGPAGVSRRTLVRGLTGGGALAAAAAAALGASRWLSPRRPSDPLVAVLPFDNLSPDRELGYFADGLSEDILNALIRGGGVRVTSRSSSFTFRGAAKAKAADALKADYLLDGSVLRAGTRLRVNANLSRSADRQTLWSDSYDRDLGQGLQIEDEVASQVASALKVQFARNEGPDHLIDPVAYDLYLKGRAATREHTPESVRRGGELLRAAVERAPTFSAAWFELAVNYLREGFLTPLAQQLVGFDRGRQAAQRAFALDPRNGAAFGIQGEFGPRYGRWAEIAAFHAGGLRISPNAPDLMLWQGNFLVMAGRPKEAIAVLKRCQGLDPVELAVNHTLWTALNAAGRFDEAGVLVDRIAAIWPGQVAAYWDRFWLLALSGREAAAADWLLRPGPHADIPEEYAVLRRAVLASTSASSDDRSAAGQACLTLARLGTGYAGNAMMLLAKLGLDDQAVKLAEALYLKTADVAINRDVQFLGNSRFPMHGEAETTPLFSVPMALLRRTGRLNRVFDGVGLTAYWAKAGRPDP